MKSCPKCGSNILVPNDDGDIECICGFIIYNYKPLPFKGNRGRHILFGVEYSPPKIIAKVP